MKVRALSLLFLLFLSVTVVSAQSPCEVLRISVDESGEKEVQLKKDLLWTYSEDILEAPQLTRPFIMAYGGLLSIGDKVYLSMDVNIASLKAAEIYGTLTVGKPVKLSFLDGQVIYLDLLRSEPPRLEKDGLSTTYSILALLDKKDLKAIRKCEWDKIGLVWSGGYEEYEVYHVDALKEQYQCLRKHSK
jgi:hypothetical protein